MPTILEALGRTGVLGYKAQELNLAGRQITGELPREIGSLTQLTILRLHKNQLTGKIPREIGSLTQLTELALADNQFTGTIVPEIGSLAQLTTLFLYNNQLTGKIPRAIGLLTKLTLLNLRDNQLTGEIPLEIGSLTQLTILRLDNNQLTGEIPPEIGLLTKLTCLRLDNNQLTGEIPSSLMKLKAQVVNIGKNYFAKSNKFPAHWKCENACQEILQKQVIQRNRRLEEMIVMMRNISVGNISNYSVSQTLGHGGFGVVYMCDFSISKYSKPRKVALKMIINFDGLTTSSVASKNQNEYFILYHLADIHENIIHLLGQFLAKPTLEMVDLIPKNAGISDSVITVDRRTGKVIAKTTQFFVLEYHPNNLQQILNKLGKSVTNGGRALKYCIQCAKALEYLYQSHIAHRDIKPDNILVSENDDLIFSDFGEALMLGDDYFNVTELRGGNLRYAAPEVFNSLKRREKRICFGKQYSWELGLLMHVIVFGKNAFDSYPSPSYGSPYISVPALDVRRLQAELRPGEVPEGFVPLMVQLLRNSPNDRIGITEALNTLERMGA